MAKEGYKPTSGMQSAARRALKWKEEGKAKGAGTAVGWTRAGQLSRGESLSLDTVKRMYSFFSRHEVDKKGKGFFDGPEFPSNGRIMWDAWGGDGGFSWSRSIVNREKKAGEMKKALVANDLVEEIKSILDDVINPITIEKAVKPEVSKETLLEIIKELQEIIVGMVEIEEEEPEEEDMEEPEMETPEAPESVGNEIEDANNMRNTWPMAKSSDEEKEDKEEIYKTDDPEDKWDNEMQKCWSGYTQRGMKEKGGRMVPNCVPVEKAEDLSEADQVKKSLFSFMDPYDLVKRKFTTAQRKKMAEEGQAMPDGSFPIANKTDLMNAIRSWGRGGADPKVKEHIKRRARALDAADMIPENWK